MDRRIGFWGSLALFLWLFLCLAQPMVAMAQDWKPPKDNLYTEEQLTRYVAASKESLAALEAAGKATQGTNSGVAALAIAGNLDEKQKAILAKHDLKEEEYRWMTERVWEAWGVLVTTDLFKQADADLQARDKQSTQQIADARKKLSDYEAAAKSGKRVLTPEERESAVKGFNDEQQSHLDEAKTRADEAKAAEDEAKTHDTEAKTADDAAKAPPADLTGDDKTNFIEGKKQDAQTARTAAREARDRATEAHKAEADAKSLAAAADARAKDPETPVTDDEKAQAKQQATDGLQQARDELATTTDATQMVKDGIVQNQKNLADAKSKAPEANVTLLTKHRDEFEKAWKIKTQSK